MMVSLIKRKHASIALHHSVLNVAASPAASGILLEVHTLRFHSDLF